MHAANDVGDSAKSVATASVAPAAVPSAPTGLSVTAGAGQATVSFTAPASDNGSAITGYTVTLSPGGLTASCPGSQCTITGLANGTAYAFTVHATNGIGDCPESSASSPVTPAAAVGAPTAVSIAAGNHQAVASFTVPTANGLAITGYPYSLDGGRTWHPLATTGSARRTGTISGLVNGRSYTAQIRGVNSMGGGTASRAITAAPHGAPPPVTELPP